MKYSTGITYLLGFTIPLTSTYAQQTFAPDLETLVKQLDGLPRPEALRAPLIRIAILPFRSETGVSNAEWFGNSIPAYLKKALERRYEFSELKIPDDSDAIIKSLPKRNLSPREKLLFSAAYLSADALIVGTFHDVQGKDAIVMTPKIFFSQSRDLVELPSFEVPISSDVAQVAADIAEKLGKVIESRGQQIEAANAATLKRISFAKATTIYFKPLEVGAKKSDVSISTSAKTLADSVHRYAENLLRAQYPVSNGQDAEHSDFVFAHRLELPKTESGRYRFTVEIFQAGQTKPFRVSASHRELRAAVERSYEKILQYLYAQTFSLAGEIFGLQESVVVLELDEREMIGVNTGASRFRFTSRIAAGKNYAIAVKDNLAGARDCFVYAGSRSLVFAAVDTPYLFCAHRAYPVSVKLDGLLSSDIDVSLDGKEILTLKENGVREFERYVDDRDSYRVSINRQPDRKGLSCSIAENATGRLAGKSPPAVEIRCARKMEQDIYASIGPAFFNQPDGTTTLQNGNNFPYNSLGVAGAGLLGYRARYLLPWDIEFGGEIGYAFAGGSADISSGSGKTYYTDQKFGYSLLEFRVYSGYRFALLKNLTWMPALGFNYALNFGSYNGQNIYRRQQPGIAGLVTVQYTLTPRWFLESTVRGSYYLTDINYFVVYAGLGGGMRF